ncbi:MAG: transcription elongation factor GreA [bacterium]|nr:transcription elongation factor GreA [bacterium]MDZ4299500.1 transcription elongation factor GreA [Candidatus Sungbacteria bacterium]
MPEYFSAEGLEKLKEELHELKTDRIKDIASRLEHARSLGDLSENAEYQEAKEEQALVESQIIEVEERIRNAIIIQDTVSTDRVAIGSTVKVKSKHGEESYRIVGSEEASPLQGRISNESPMGKAFLGKKVKDETEVKTPGGTTTYTIVGIS